MEKPIKAVILDDETVVIDGFKLVEMDEIAHALQSAFQNDPNFILVIEATNNASYRGTGKVIYASQRAGIPVESLRYTAENGEVVTLDELRARGSTSSM